MAELTPEQKVLIATVKEYHKTVDRFMDAYGWMPLVLAAYEQAKRDFMPSHTDLMVPPESIDAFVETNPLPPDQEEKTT